MEILSLTKDKYQKWNDFCLKSNDAFFWHTTHYLEYTLSYKPGSISLSFLVTENREILAICPLILKDNEFELFWSPAFANLPDKKKEKVVNFTFDHIDKLALDNNVVRTSLMIYPLSFPRNNYLMKQGYIDISLNTQVIDLTQDLKVIHGAMRKGHDYDTDRGLKELDTSVYTYISMSEFISYDIFDQYCKLHEKDAGRITRPEATWIMQRTWILKNNAILVGAKYGNQYIGFSYISTYKKKAYYSSACSDPSFYQMPIGHVLTWKAIEWLKEHGFEYFELGWQQYGTLPYDFPSKKEIEISFFKRGFGGFTLPLFRGEKYYSSDYYLKVSIERIDKYISSLIGDKYE